MNASVVLEQSKQSSILRGHPWIFPKAIAKTIGHLQTGELVSILNAEGALVGTGVYNEHSLYRVRVLALAFEKIDCSSFAGIVKHRLRQALTLRQALNLPNEATNAYRLFNSEADGLSGLTIDCFNTCCAVSSSAYWVEAQRSEIIACLQEIMPCDEVIWLSQSKPLNQDGWEAEAEAVNPRVTEIVEGGVRFQIDFSTAQKTGLFIDQRENHQRIAALAKGKKVLDLYSYTGGFALHAAKAGALKVTAVDSSKPAIEQAIRNAQLNGVNQVEWVAADARDYLAQAGHYDLIILDPPKLVPSRRDLNRAKNYYRFLHREVFKAMTPGSLLMTCNCSSALSAQEFAALAASQAAMVGKQVRLVGIFGPASCHPTLPSFPEGNYLTAVLLAVV
ncbi:class I SAM-dependent rRNA methyltransferase [Legionella taurinensis]|uniref:Class I SAM-dependent rRNA methyltransferase n=1 Tax=Legionella taurinensis TaxID=70611 RepID=A0A3A5L5V8_9GAMM|nr:class I SAM-dependent rRNA methyltransferase [Legionella taurinensis]MDX1836977.1 class I SAM-dependent rRNA methyltransferase [Legionella taurinensis]PUT41385.1 class I SAM-dependent rRNA methyltransferase [Legionella taurinensis]PUT42624.1 class I SAM-dependent rRNA methyltransferase [Legionella taurinensis]PUT46652.1 class I SAM-dependent rRNA methyltransferase [Legionella taurinensis]PUT47301.1 class I SAM-dependent rRNA methyltransferase [Legionella taurinensis]